MAPTDFPTWFALGSYGGVACSLVVAAALAIYAIGWRRGSPLALARGVLLCLVACGGALLTAWWLQTRFDLLGPRLAMVEVIVALAAVALFGWALPVGALAGYLLLTPARAGAFALALRHRAVAPTTLAALSDPARQVEPLGAGVAWGQLVPLDAPEARPLLLTRQLTILGREVDSDIVLIDERTSRHHVEIHWDHGHPQLRDRGSLNGTLLNQQAVCGVVPLCAGDTLEMGGQRFRFALTDAPSAPLAEAAGVASAPSTDVLTAKMPSAEPLAPHVAGDLAASGHLELVARGERLAGERWALRSPLTTLGREASCHVRLADPSVSRVHAQISLQPAGLFLTDLGSSNGTYVNGERLLAPRPIRPGDLVRLGEVTLRCELATSVAPAPPTRRATPLALPTVAINGHAASSGERAASDPAAANGARHTRVTLADRPRIAPPRLTPSQPPAPSATSEGTATDGAASDGAAPAW